jgi:uncharacterized RDD family membrane protein YckC
MKENLTLIYEELFGEKVDHPLIRRALAFAIDCLIFWLLDMAIFYPFDRYELQVNHGSNILIPFWIVCFTLCNSKFFKGQTPGRKLFRIRVVDKNGQYLGIGKSLVRSLPIVLFLCQFDIAFFIFKEVKQLLIPWAFIITAIFIGAIYFPLIRTERQALHDLLVGSQVVSIDRNVKIENKVSWVSLLVFIVITVLVVALM